MTKPVLWSGVGTRAFVRVSVCVARCSVYKAPLLTPVIISKFLVDAQGVSDADTKDARRTRNENVYGLCVRIP